MGKQEVVRVLPLIEVEFMEYLARFDEPKSLAFGEEPIFLPLYTWNRVIVNCLCHFKGSKKYPYSTRRRDEGGYKCCMGFEGNIITQVQGDSKGSSYTFHVIFREYTIVQIIQGE